MSTSSASYSPGLESVLAAVAKLSREEKEVLVEQVEAGLADESDIPACHLEILAEREREVEDGRAEYVPWEEARLELRKEFGLQ